MKQVFFVRIILVDCDWWMVVDGNLLKDHLGHSDDHGLHCEADDRHYDRQLREFKLHWIEEPTNPDDVLAHQAIAQVDNIQKITIFGQSTTIFRKSSLGKVSKNQNGNLRWHLP